MSANTAVLCLPAFPPWGVFCSLLLLKDPLSPARESSPHLSSGIMTEQNSQSRTQRRMGSHRPPAPNVRSPLYQRILQFQALISLGQQGIDVRKFALRFSGAVEGLGYNDAALKDLLNSALEEPPNWWRMRSLEHLIFGEFPGVRSGSPQSPLREPTESAPQVVVLSSTLVASCSAGTTVAPLSTSVARPSASTQAWPTIPLSDPPPTHPPPRHYLVLVCGASRIRSLKANVF